MVGAETAMHRAAQRAQRRAREIAVHTHNRRGSAQSGTTDVAVTISVKPGPRRTGPKQTTIGPLSHDPLQFDVRISWIPWKTTPASRSTTLMGKDQVSISSEKAALQESPATRLHGRRIEAMFGRRAVSNGAMLVGKERRQSNRPLGIRT